MPRTRSVTTLNQPAGAGETIIATISGLNIPLGSVIDLEGMLDITIGTGGINCTLQIRRGTTLTGTSIYVGGATGLTAGNQYSIPCNTQDVFATDQGNLAYTLTAQVGSASAASTIVNVYLGALFGP